MREAWWTSPSAAARKRPCGRASARYRRSISHRSAVSLWEADTSGPPRRPGLPCLPRSHRYCRVHAGEPRVRRPGPPHDPSRRCRCTTVPLFDAGTREELLGPLSVSFDASALAGLVPAAIANATTGRQHEIETSVVSRVRKGLERDYPLLYSRRRRHPHPHACEFVVDITERTQAEEERASLELQLRHAQKVEMIGTPGQRHLASISTISSRRSWEAVTCSSWKPRQARRCTGTPRR